MAFNNDKEGAIKSSDGTELEEANNFKYLSAWMESTEKDIKFSKAVTRRACKKLAKIWKASPLKTFKLRMFTVTLKSVLFYGCETWTISTKLPMS